MMRRKTVDSGRLAAEAGRQFAGELSSMFAHARLREASEALEKKSTAQWVNTLRKVVYQGVYGFNQHVPAELQLAILDRGDRLVFNSCGRFTLALIYGKRQVALDQLGSDSDFRNVPTMELEMWSDEHGLRFRPLKQPHPQPLQTLSEVQFVYEVIRMACLRGDLNKEQKFD